jgi:hypothetical protein
MATLIAGLATAVRLAVPPLCVMLQGSVPACTTLLDEHVISAALVTTSIPNVFVSIKCLSVSKVCISIQGYLPVCKNCNYVENTGYFQKF